MTTTAGSIESKREALRDSLFLSAIISIDGLGGPLTVRVRNLSIGGMMVDGNAGFIVGTLVTSTLRGIGEVTGRVAWTTPGRAGISFDADIDPRMARVPVSAKTEESFYGKPFDYTRRPGLKVRP